MKTTKGVSQHTGEPFDIEEHSDLNSVEISLTAKGDAQVSIKVYAETTSKASEEAVTVLTDTISALTDKGIHVVGV